MRDRARTLAIARKRPAFDPAAWLAALALAAALLAAAAAHAQGTAQGGATDGHGTPPAIGQGPANNDAAPGRAAGSVQRGSDGVIAPPSSVDPSMPIGRPSPDAFPTPTLRPPGAPGGDPKVVPK